MVEFELSLTVTGRTSFVSHSLLLSAEFTLTATDIFCVQIKKRHTKDRTERGLMCKNVKQLLTHVLVSDVSHRTVRELDYDFSI